MHFSPEVNQIDFPRVFQEFIEITGHAVWDKRFAWLEQQQQQNPFIRGYHENIYAIEMKLNELVKKIKANSTFNTHITDPTTYRLFAFVAAATMIYQRLSSKGKRRLRGKLLGSLRDKDGLTPFEQEISVAAHLMGRGFDVSFTDLEGDARFDFLAVREHIELEVECKRVGHDLGRKIPRYEVYQLHNLLHKELASTFPQVNCGLFLKVILPSRLTAHHDQQNSIAALVGRALRTGVDIENEELCKVVVSDFAIDGSPFMQTDPSQPQFLESIRAFAATRFGSTNRELFIMGVPRKRAIVASIESAESDAVLNRLFNELSTSAKNQFTKSRPGVLCVQFIGLTNEQVQRLGTASDNGPKQPSALLVKTSKFLADERRGHIHTVAYRGISNVTYKSSVTGNVATSEFQGQGAAYVISNDYHPFAKDRRYFVFSK